MLEKIKSEGFSRVRVDGEIYELDEEIKLEKNKWHNIEIVIDRLIINSNVDKNRISSSVETGLKYGNGVIYVDKISEEEIIYSELLACTECNISLSELDYAETLQKFIYASKGCIACWNEMPNKINLYWV